MKRNLKKLLICSMVATMTLQQIGLPAYAEEPQALEAQQELEIIEEPQQELEIIEEPQRELEIIEEPQQELEIIEEPQQELDINEVAENLEAPMNDSESTLATPDDSITTPAALETTASGTYGDSLTWTLDSEGLLTISGTGAPSGSAPWSSYRSQIKKVIVGEGVTAIGSYAFSNCSALTEIQLPSTLTSIAENAFYYCSSLAEIQLPSHLTSIGSWAFYHCISLTEIQLPTSLTRIASCAFYECNGLTEIQLPDSVTTLGYNAFYNCASLESVKLSSGLTQIESSLFAYCKNLKTITIPSGVTFIGSDAFNSCTSLEEITIPENVTYMDYRAFYECKSLKKVTLNSKLKSICSNTFYRCTSLSEMTLPEGLTEIGDSAFRETGLQRVTLPDSLTSLGQYAFYSCKSLEYVKIGSSLKTIPNYCFYNCTALTQVDFSESLETIGTDAFYYCTALKEVKLPSNIKTITSAFCYCTGLQKVELDLGTADSQVTGDYAFVNSGASSFQVILHGNGAKVPDYIFSGANVTDLTLDSGITTIGCNAFYGNKNLTFVNLPGVTEIENYAFNGCTSISQVQMKKVQKIGSYAFNDVAITSLKDADLPELKEIADNAFYYCTSLKEVQLSGLTTIPANAFYSCSALTKVSLPNVTSIGNYAFCGTALTSFDSSAVTELGSYVFYNCANLANVNLPNITTLPAGIFGKCTSLKNYSIPANVTSIGANAFTGCSSITAISIPEGVDSIGDYAFQETGLTEITIPASVARLGYSICKNVSSLQKITYLAKAAEGSSSGGAFYGTANTTPLEIIVRAKTIPKNCFSNLKIASVDLGDQLEKINEYAFYNTMGITSITLPDSVTWIGNYALSCNNLASVKMPASLTFLAEYAFYFTPYYNNMAETDGLKMNQGWVFKYNGSASTLTLPEGTRGIAVNAFYGNTAITKVILPASLTSICDYAFYNCKNLEEIEIRGSLDYLGEYAFTGTKWLDSMELKIIHLEDGDYFFGYTGSDSVLTLPESVKYVNLSSGSISSNVTKIIFTSEPENISTYSFQYMNCAVEFPTALSYMELAEKYGYRAIRGTYIAKTAARTWWSANSGFVGTNDQILSLNGDSLTSLASRRMARLIMEEEHITNMKEAYDWLCSNCGYNYATGYPYSCADGPFLYGVASCQGYALAMKAFLDELGIMNHIAIGFIQSKTYGRVAHAWNMVGGRVVDATDTRKGDYSTYNKDLFDLPQYEVTASNEAANAVREEAAYAVRKDVNMENGPLAFSLNDDGTYTVSECALKATSIVIPSTYNGKPVTAIGDNAFINCAKLTSVTIPYGIKSIGAYAFKNCIGLKEIQLPASVNSLGIGAFLSCISLKKADLSYTSIETIPTYTFAGCLDLYEIYLPKTVTSINSYSLSVAIKNNTALTFTCKIYGAAGSAVEVFANGKGIPFEEWSVEPGKLKIKSQPQNVSAGLNTSVTFTVDAENAASYQWYYSKNGTKWTKSGVASGTTNALTLKVSTSNKATIYRCEVTGINGEQIITDSASVDFIEGVIITQQPKSNAVATGEYAEFTIVAENAASYQWQYSKDGAHWYNSGASGNQTDTLTVKGEQKSQGNRYRCKVTGIDGNVKKSLASAMIVMTVAPKASTVKVGGTATFSLKAVGVDSYQWQYSKDGGETWYKSGGEGATTDTVTFTVTTSNRKNIYRCKLMTEDGASAFTKAVGFE